MFFRLREKNQEKKKMINLENVVIKYFIMIATIRKISKFSNFSKSLLFIRKSLKKKTYLFIYTCHPRFLTLYRQVDEFMRHLLSYR